MTAEIVDRTTAAEMVKYPWIRFELNEKKCLEGIQFLAGEKPGITQYYIGKVFFFADKAHFLDWGRPISGDRYVAMEHGPVPSFIYDMLKKDSGEPDELEDELAARVDRVRENNKIRFYAKSSAPTPRFLSRSDKEYLTQSLSQYSSMPFDRIRSLSHEDPAYDSAWAAPGLNNELDLRRWLSTGQLEELFEKTGIVRARRVG